MSDNKKSPLEKALLEAREIEKAAFESAKKVLEESAISKIEEAVKGTLEEIEKETVEEGVSINVGDADISVNVENGETSIDVDAEEEDLVISSEGESEEDEMDSMEDEMDSDDSEESDSMEDEEDEMEDEMEEIFEIMAEEEEELAPVPAEAPTEEAPVEEMPAEEMPADEAPVEEMPADEAPLEGGESTVEVPTASAIEDLSSKLDMILSKLDAPEEAAEEAGEEVPATEEAPEEIGAEGEVEIVDDEAPAEAPAEEEMVAEDGIFELDASIFEEDLAEEIEIVGEDDDEIEIEIPDEEETMDEMKMMGASHAAQRTAGENPGPEVAVKNRGRNISENIAHDEADIAELKKENESLRESLKEYKESFKVLRKQINEVQTFNAKLAFVNKLFSKGGLTNDEKIQIAESFDEVETVEEAKTLYNKIINENKSFSSNSKTEQLKKLKSTNPAVVTPSTKSEALYESTEISRMKHLAGIKPLNS
jgi:hypothetical protein